MPQNQKNRSFTRSTKPGTSLLVALGLTTIIVLVSLGVTTIVVSSTRESANVTGANQAYYAAEGALEKGLLINQTKGAGYSAGDKVLEGATQKAASDSTDKTFAMNNFDPSTGVPYPKSGFNYGDTTANGTAARVYKETSSYKISGQVPFDSTYGSGEYGIPTPGTGNVGENCDSLHPTLKDPFYYDAKNQTFYSKTPEVLSPEDLNGLDSIGDGMMGFGMRSKKSGAESAMVAPPQNLSRRDTSVQAYDPKDHPCNWNKIKAGEPVTIPLYVTQPNGDILNPKEAGLSTLKIRVRLPCKNGTPFCANIDRFNFDYLTSSPEAYNKTNDTVMSWQITASNLAGNKSYLLSPLTIHGKHLYLDQPYSGFDRARLEPDNSEIYESQINFLQKSSDNVVVTNDDSGKDSSNKTGTIQDFLTDGGFFTGYDINKPVLKLSVIHSLHSDTDSTIPYLEYQILTNSLSQPTDSSQTITADGYSGTFKQVLEVKNPQDSSVIEYVIQQ